MKSLKGQLLVASPQLTDPNFHRTVVFMLEHNDEGAMGVVLNRPSSMTVQEVWQQLEAEPTESLESINIGGPVPGPLLALHNDKEISETEVLPGLHLSSRREYLDALVRSQARYRLYSGYAGWGGGQLDEEMRAGGWLTHPATVDHVFFPADELWHKVGQDITQAVLGPTLRRAEIPPDPTLN